MSNFSDVLKSYLVISNRAKDMEHQLKIAEGYLHKVLKDSLDKEGCVFTYSNIPNEVLTYVRLNGTIYKMSFFPLEPDLGVKVNEIIVEDL